ncbi:hypothetical protein LJB85_03705 [Porphyromonadaceae bacterium OttesenSCG-928-L07]|nr:hypothetical protein [Porphyromonadaceae bacterium OttesenSCG-928-L07]MDL2252316.1 hypothetical protein [Odoribacter sp. OttesenSCG-928-J03]MDL2331159.1 hypothetical protein [Odoribacter sp. OttesenSCG-928-A06]
MASIKRLKKDIDYLTFAVIADSINYSILNDKDNEQVSEIITEVVSVRNDMRTKINGAKKFENSKETKKFYNGVFKETLTSIDAAFTKLSETVKKA